MTGVVLDSGALIALDRGERRVALRIRRAREQSDPIAIPVGCVAQVWRDGSRQARLAKLLAERGVTVESLDPSDGRRIGILLGRTDTTDVIDGHVALLALGSDATVLTSAPDDIRRLAPTARIVAV